MIKMLTGEARGFVAKVVIGWFALGVLLGFLVARYTNNDDVFREISLIERADKKFELCLHGDYGNAFVVDDGRIEDSCQEGTKIIPAIEENADTPRLIQGWKRYVLGPGFWIGWKLADGPNLNSVGQWRKNLVDFMDLRVLSCIDDDEPHDSPHMASLTDIASQMCAASKEPPACSSFVENIKLNISWIDSITKDYSNMRHLKEAVVRGIKIRNSVISKSGILSNTLKDIDGSNCRTIRLP